MTIQAAGRTHGVFFHNSAFSVRTQFEDESRPGTDREQDDAWLNSLWYEVEAVVQSVTDSLGFVLAASPNLELTSGVVGGEGRIATNTALHQLSRVAGDHVEPDMLGRYHSAAAGNENIRHALADMRMATRLSTDTAFYCYRAIECLRQEFVEPDDGQKNSSILGSLPRRTRHIPGGDMGPLTRAATPRRHGESPVLPHTERVEFLRWTREVVARYIDQVSSWPAT